MIAPGVVAERCNWCSKFRPRYRFHLLASGQRICDYCLAGHGHALEVLAGAMPAGCSECRRTWEQLTETAVGTVRMSVVPKDGILQLLCESCTAPYARKRADLYGGTQFGSDLKL